MRGQNGRTQPLWLAAGCVGNPFNVVRPAIGSQGLTECVAVGVLPLLGQQIPGRAVQVNAPTCDLGLKQTVFSLQFARVQ